MDRRVSSKPRMADMQFASESTRNSKNPKVILDKLSAGILHDRHGHNSSQLRAAVLWGVLVLVLLGLGMGFKEASTPQDWSKALLVICVDGSIMYILMRACKYINKAIDW